MRSASRGCTAAVALALAGCATTQQEATRLQLNSARIRASQIALRITARVARIRVVKLALIHTAGGTAVVVQVRNGEATATSDLSILLSLRAPGRRGITLNGGANQDYFRTHLPVIEPGSTITWVFTTRRRLTPGVKPSIEIGAPNLDWPISIGTTLPRITVESLSTKGAAVTAEIHNDSGVPQYQLPVFGVATRDGRYVAAGELTVAHLTNGATGELRLHLLGSASGATLALEALPTIFH